MDAFLCEYSTIGALLIDPEAYPEAAELRPDDFLHPAFAAVFRAIQRRNDAGHTTGSANAGEPDINHADFARSRHRCGEHSVRALRCADASARRTRSDTRADAARAGDPTS